MHHENLLQRQLGTNVTVIQNRIPLLPTPRMAFIIIIFQRETFGRFHARITHTQVL